MISFMDIIGNKPLIAVGLTLIFSQLIKSVIIWFKEKKYSIIPLFKMGGMPSTHAAIVTCLTISILLLEGISYLFVAALVFSIVIIRDALGVRQTIGEQAKIISKLGLKVWKRSRYKLSGSIGHVPSQVIVGMLLGALISFLVVCLWPV